MTSPQTSPTRAVVDRMFAAFAAKDLDAAVATVTEDSVWTHHGSQKMQSVRFTGRSGVSQFFHTSFNAMSVHYFRPLTFIEDGDTIAVTGEESFDMQGVDGTLTNRWVQIYTLRDGLIARMDEYATSAADTDYIHVR